jgi:hypothetical protein
LSSIPFSARRGLNMENRPSINSPIERGRWTGIDDNKRAARQWERGSARDLWGRRRPAIARRRGPARVLASKPRAATAAEDSAASNIAAAAGRGGRGDRSDRGSASEAPNVSILRFSRTPSRLGVNYTQVPAETGSSGRVNYRNPDLTPSSIKNMRGSARSLTKMRPPKSFKGI